MNISTHDIQTLRQKTGVGMMDAKRALAAADGDIELAIKELRQAGLKLAAKKSGRAVSEGVVEAYVHTTGRVAAIVGLACETDFVARTDDFINLAHELAMQVAATNPKYLKPEDVPAAVVAEETAVYRAQSKAEKKPANVQDKIIAGKLDKFYTETCLLNQPSIRDDKKTVNDLLIQATTQLGENIKITNFARLAI